MRSRQTNAFQIEVKEKPVKHTLSAACLLFLAAGALLCAQEASELQVSRETHPSGGGHIVIPTSTSQRPSNGKMSSHTNFLIFVPAGRAEGKIGFSEEEINSRDTLPLPASGSYAETPASLACIYGLVTSATAGCSPATLTNSQNATGGSKAIAIVDAYDYPTAMADLAAYSSYYGLPAPSSSNFTVVYQDGKTPPLPDPSCDTGGGWSCWATESALDIEMAHAAAPSAHIYLVEADSSSDADLFAAVKIAIAKVKAAGGGEVSMSWGENENDGYVTLAGEQTYDGGISGSAVTGANVVFFAASGDSEGTIYPSTSPYVVAVGGTTVSRNPATLAFQGELTWEDTGGGLSVFESRPSFQSGISGIVGGKRGVPDVAAVGNPRTGVWVYNSFDNVYDVGGVAELLPWDIIGGTSVASPLWAGIANHAGNFSATSTAELSTIYKNASNAKDYRDISVGTCGYYEGYLAAAGWDPCSGNGTPQGSAGK